MGMRSSLGAEGGGLPQYSRQMSSSLHQGAKHQDDISYCLKENHINLTLLTIMG